MIRGHVYLHYVLLRSYTVGRLWYALKSQCNRVHILFTVKFLKENHIIIQRGLNFIRGIRS